MAPQSGSKRTLTVTFAAIALPLGLAAIVVCGSVLLQGPTSETPPSAADWLSAIATFWGAVATAVGALLTGGALVYAARTYEKQRQDRHEELVEKRRAQASAVTLVMTRPAAHTTWEFVVRNDSSLPIFCMNMVGVNAEGQHKQRHYLHPVLTGPRGLYDESLPVDSTEEASFVEFRDAAGAEWKRYADGRLVEEPLSTGNRN
ncbi:hypothetical protein [Arthrobacter sp. NicSoilC5]|uniref:hypothetical protein n=1 Tax=Arthrobacter sp. NicSoilC5 TaxID=2831000 RepID=UPI001CC3FD96|nr:hypothetical protein [Arthrobacter sp. NicSoilC5]BCW78296.1 hypothetical protein NicSoilC5_03150 [Arthrobacter sp. NicSoilC5]